MEVITIILDDQETQIVKKDTFQKQFLGYSSVNNTGLIHLTPLSPPPLLQQGQRNRGRITVVVPLHSTHNNQPLSDSLWPHASLMQYPHDYSLWLPHFMARLWYPGLLQTSYSLHISQPCSPAEGNNAWDMNPLGSFLEKLHSLCPGLLVNLLLPCPCSFTHMQTCSTSRLARQ
jgi:hypothetical protein